MSTTQIALNNVYQALEAASFQDNSDQRKVGEEQLNALEIIPGFHSFVLDVSLNTSFPLSVRCFAAIYLKDGIIRYWHDTTTNGITDDEKAQIRLHLFEMLKEPNKSLNTEYALIIAEIAMNDLPYKWPSLFTDVSNLVASAQATGSITELNNLLNTLYQIVKILPIYALSDYHLGLQVTVSDLFKIMGPIYLQSIQKWMQWNDLSSMEVGCMALRVIGEILIRYHPNYNRSEEVKLFKSSVEYFHEFFSIYDKHPTEPVAEYIRIHGNTYAHICQWQPALFIMMPKALQLIQTYLSIVQSKASIIEQVGSADEDKDIVEFWETIVVQGLKILNKVFTLRSTRVVSNNIEQESEVKQAVGLLEKSLFAPETIKSLLDLLVTSYLKLTPRDLENLQYDREEWVNCEMSYLLPNHARGYAQQMVTELYCGTSDPFGPPLLMFVEKACESDDLLIRDVAYNLFVRTGKTYFQEFDFDEMLVKVFMPQCFQKGSSHYSIIRRRISMIISTMVSEECSDKSRIEIYKLLDHLLDPTDPLNKKFVRMYACQALRITIDVPNPKIPDFLPYLPRILKHMFVLLTKDLILLESKKCVLQVISVVINRVGYSIAPYNDLIMQVLSPLWDKSGDNHQVKCPILQTMTSLIRSMGENSLKCYPLAISMLKILIDPGSKLVCHLLEDATMLWLVLMENAPAFNEDLLQLLPVLINIIRYDPDVYINVLKVLESYLLLDFEYVFQHYGQAMFELFAQYLPNGWAYQTSIINDILDLIFQKNDTGIMNYGERLLVDSGLFTTLLAMLSDEKKLSPNTCVKILGSFSRLAYANAGAFVHYVEAIGIPTAYKEQHPGLSAVVEDDAVGVLLDFWLGKFDNMEYPRQRKLNALGLTSLVRTGHASIMQRLQDIVVIWLQMLNEVHESGEDDVEVYYTNDETSHLRSVRNVRIEEEAMTIAAEQELFSSHSMRRIALNQKDPVYTVCLKDYINTALVEVGALSADHAKIVSTALDPALIDTLSEVLK